MSKISVIVPMYNSEKTIRRCAKSILAQTYDDYEVIFVNDGSTDKTERIIQKMCGDKNNVMILSKKNGGSASSRNMGIDHSKGDYICFVDSDDIISPNYLKTMYDLVNGKDIVCVKYVRNKESDFEKVVDSSRILNSKEAVEALLKMEIDNGPVAKLFSRKVIGDNRMPDVVVAEDLSFNYATFKKAKHVVVNESILYSYIMERGSLSTKDFSPERMGSLKVVQDINKTEKSFYSKARVFMEAYFICESIVLSKGANKYAEEYETVCKILKKERKAILSDKRATKRQKLIASLLKFGPKFTVNLMTVKQRFK